MEMRECVIRKAEPPGDRVKGCLFFAGAPLTSRIRRRRGAAMRRILVDDDDMHTRPAMGLWLKQCGFRVAITNGGERGLAAVIDGCLPEAELQRKHATALAAIAGAPPNISAESANTG
jgi:hypothetical protein